MAIYIIIDLEQAAKKDLKATYFSLVKLMWKSRNSYKNIF